MTDDRIRVSRSLYVSALADAIDWQASLLESQNHDDEMPGGVRCCTPKARCETYRETAALLARYRRAWRALTGSSTAASAGADMTGNEEPS